VPETRERRGSSQCAVCHGLGDGPETGLDPFACQRLCGGDPECRAAVVPVSALPLTEYLATPEGAKKIDEWVR
jgi:hypothetical protein